MNTAPTAWLDEHRWLAIAVAALGVALYLVATEVAPRVREGYGLFAAWRAETAQLAEVTSWQAEEAEIRTWQERLEARFQALFVRLPRTDQASAILQVFQESAGGDEVDIEAVRPGERVVHASHDELPFHVDVRGSFEGVTRFLHRVERSRYVMKVTGLDVVRSDPQGLLEAAIDVSVIVLKEQEGE